MNPVVYSRTYRANENPACDNGSNGKLECTAPADVKQAGSGDICHAMVSVHNTYPNLKHTVTSNAGHANVNHVREANANVKPLCSDDMTDHGSNAGHANVNHVCEADTNVKPLCNNDVSDHDANSFLWLKSYTIPYKRIAQKFRI